MSNVNFRQIVESLLVEAVADSKTPFRTGLDTTVDKLYKLNGNKNEIGRKINDFLNVASGRLTASGGYAALRDDEIRSYNRYNWPLIDTGFAIREALNKNALAFKGLVVDNKTLDDVVTTTNYPNLDPADLDSIKQGVLHAIQNLDSKSSPANYNTFVNYRLQKLNSDLSQLTVQRYNGLTILNAITEMSKLRGNEDKKTIKAALTTPLDFLTGQTTVSEKFDTEVIDIGGALVNFYRTTLESAGASSASIAPIGTKAGLNTRYGTSYTKFVEGDPNPNGIFKTVKTLGDLQKVAPDVYAKIQEYSKHIKRGDPPPTVGKRIVKAAGGLIGAAGRATGGILDTLSGFKGF